MTKMAKITIVGKVFIVCILGLATGQELKLCPNTGPLHLPPPGCALRKNFAAEQTCYTISVVCNEGQGTNTPANMGAATSPEPEPTTPSASIDSPSQEIDKSKTVCPVYTDVAFGPPAECDAGQRECSQHNECGVIEVCCQDDACKKKVCKAQLLPCSSNETETIPWNCALQVVVDKEKNCLKTIGECPQGGTTPSNEKDPGGTPGNVPKPRSLVSKPAGSVSANTDKAKPTGATCPFRDPEAKANPSSCDKNQKKCDDDSECAANELCCADDDCEATVCKKTAQGVSSKSEATTPRSPVFAFARAAPVFAIKTEAAKLTCPDRDPNAVSNPAKCNKALKNCSDDSECAAKELCCADDDCEATVCKPAVAAAASDAAAPKSGKIAGDADRASPTPAAKTTLAPGTTTPAPSTAAGTSTSALAAAGVTGQFSCPPRDPEATINPAKCDRSLKNCSDDSECGKGDLCCADDDCEGTFCKKGVAAEAVNATSGSGTRTRTGNGIETSNDAVSQQNATKDDNKTSSTVETIPAVLPLPIGGEIAPVPINLPGDVVPPVKKRPGSTTTSTPVSDTGNKTGGIGEVSNDATASQSASKSAAINGTTTNANSNGAVPGVLPLPIGGEVAPLPIILPGGIVTPEFPGPDVVVPANKNHTGPQSSGNGTGIASIAETSIDSTASQQSKNNGGASPQVSIRYCPATFETAKSTSAAVKCADYAKACKLDSDCAIYEVCCPEESCGGSICKASLLPCPPPPSENATTAEDCSSRVEVDVVQNCVRRICV